MCSVAGADNHGTRPCEWLVRLEYRHRVGNPHQHLTVVHWLVESPQAGCVLLCSSLAIGCHPNLGARCSKCWKPISEAHLGAQFSLTVCARTLAFLVLVLGFAAFPLSSNGFHYMCHVRKLTSLVSLLPVLHYIFCILTITLAAGPLSD